MTQWVKALNTHVSGRRDLPPVSCKLFCDLYMLLLQLNKYIQYKYNIFIISLLLIITIINNIIKYSIKIIFIYNF